MAVLQAQSLLSVQHDRGLNKPVSQTLLGRTWLYLYIKKQLEKPDPPVSMQFLLHVTRDSIFPDLFGAADEEDKTSQDNINGKGQFNSDDNDYEDKDDGSEEDKLGNDAILTEADIF